MRLAVVIAVVVGMFLPAQAAQWTVQPKSKLGFTVVWSAEPLNGIFKRWHADIDFDPTDLAHSHAVVSIETGSLATDYAEGDDAIKGAAGFAADQFPTARFETTTFRRQPDGSFVADGRLTIRGITRPLALPFKFSIKGNEAHVIGAATVVRTDFGVGQGEWAAPEPVAHQVNVSVNLFATRK